MGSSRRGLGLLALRLLLLSVAGAACSGGGDSTPPACTDADGDGYSAEGGACGPWDCSDSADSIHPGAVETCDGLDDDCDAATPDGLEDPMLGAACDGPDSDLCDEGALSCAGGELACSDSTGGQLDLCNGLDDDCDAASADGAEDPLLGSTCDGPDSDLCLEGTWSCVGAELACGDATAGQLDLCNGLDDDCDAASADGAEDPQLGSTCDGPDSDLCDEGTFSCAGGELACSDSTGGQLDLCNGLDDDCDAASADGSEDPMVGATCDGPDSDLCQEGTWSCGGGGLSCSDNTAGQVELCDGLDNDCAGGVDDGFPHAVLHGSLGCVSGMPELTCDATFFSCEFDPLDGCESAVPCPVGDACTIGSECPSGTCLDEVSSGLPSGLCSYDCATGSSACPADAECTWGYCFPACVGDADCRAGYSCLDGMGMARPVCFPDCVSSIECPGSGICNPYTGFCEPLRGAAPDGAACGSDADCESYYCETSLPNGYCISTCSLAGNTCAGDGVCKDVFGYSLTGGCFDGCVNSFACRTGYSCVGGACWPD